jgi:hypothetical protein
VSTAVVTGRMSFLDLKQTAFAIKPQGAARVAYWKVCDSIIGLDGSARRQGLLYPRSMKSICCPGSSPDKPGDSHRGQTCQAKVDSSTIG